MKKIVILGSDTMAGHIISDYFFNTFNVIKIKESEIFYNELIRDTFNLEIFLSANFIVNTIRCLVEDSELNKPKALLYNSYFPKRLESFFQNSSTKIIHLSTDCVFSGKNGPYNKKTKFDGVTYYSKTKQLGEINNKKDLTIRASYIGPNINNQQEELFDWFLFQEKSIC